MRSHIIRIGLIAAVGSAVAFGVDARPTSAPAPALATPPEITYGDVYSGAGNFLWRYLASLNGKPLYTFDADDAAGKPTCVDACAKEFPPYFAMGNVKAEGAWSLIKVGQGRQQWAYKGHPLYAYSGEDPVPRTYVYYADVDKAQLLDPALMDPSSDHFSPKAGWRRAAFTPQESVPTPSGISLKSMDFADGYGFADAATGAPLYVMKTAPKSPIAWTPKYAPDLAVPVGDFTIVMREDGSSQWAYQGQPLYSYNEDYSANDLNGTLAQSDARIALAYRNFMPASLRIEILPDHGPMLVTSGGMTVYSLGRGHVYGAPQGRGAYAVSYNDAKLVSINACTGDCLSAWTPVLAGPNDQASGFWEVQVRPDGLRQWAYRGGALYTFKGDKKPGDLDGDGERVIVFGKADGSDYDLVTLAGGNRGPDFRPNAGAGFYWHPISFED